MQCPPTNEWLSLVTQASVLPRPALCALTRERCPGGYGRCRPRGPSLSLLVTLSTGFVDRAGRGVSLHLRFLVEMQTGRGRRRDCLGGPRVPRGVQRSLCRGRESSGATGLDPGPCLGVQLPSLPAGAGVPATGDATAPPLHDPSSWRLPSKRSLLKGTVQGCPGIFILALRSWLGTCWRLHLHHTAQGTAQVLLELSTGTRW